MVAGNAFAGQEDDTRGSVVDTIRIGMSHAEVRDLLQKMGNALCESGHQQLGGERLLWTRVNVGPMSYLGIGYESADESKSNLGDDARVSKIEAYVFDDLIEPLRDERVRVKGEGDSIPREVWECVRTIHQAPGLDVEGFDPAALMKAVNRLLAHEEPTVIAALRTYANLADYRSLRRRGRDTSANMRTFFVRRERFDLDEHRILTVCSLLFVPTDPDVRSPGIPFKSWPKVEAIRKSWPHFPLVVVDDIPFLLSGDSVGSDGPFDGPMPLVDFCDRRCAFRGHALSPKASPIDAVERLYGFGLWRQVFRGDKGLGAETMLETDNKYYVRLQALKCLTPCRREYPALGCLVGRILPDRVGAKQADTHWHDDIGRLPHTLCLWNDATQEFGCVHDGAGVVGEGIFRGEATRQGLNRREGSMR